MEPWQRTIDCGALRADNVGENVVVNGWVHSVRDHGDLVFIDLRDRTGLVQLRADSSRCPAIVAATSACKPESVLTVTGAVRRRAEGMENPKLETGEVEIDVAEIEVLNPSKQPLPFQLNDETLIGQVNEELRVRHRYLDLRRPAMQRMLQLRHDVIAYIRRYLDERRFLEIETPIFTKSTPEGARDYLVPYRLQPGFFYALPQSPQQYKQLLMVAGCERYYQIARCFRDEAQRADRQPEFTQLDMEMSFVTQEDVLELLEGLTIGLIQSVSTKKLGATPFPRLRYDEAILRYGTDKPDLRFGLEIADVSGAVASSEFAVFRSTLEAGGVVRAVRYPGGGALSRKDVDILGAFAREFGAKGLAHIAVEELEAASANAMAATNLALRSPIAKFLSVAEADAILGSVGAQAGDLVLLVADQAGVAANVLGRLRTEIGRRLNLADPETMYFCWVTDFPLVEWNADERRWDACHHPFTMPHPEDLPLLDTDPGRVRALCYDIVCNGVEWGSGSIRIHRREIQAKVFDLLGISEQTQKERFGHILEAFEYGAPPHGGVAPGIDRLIMLLLGTENIREVMAFPKLGGGVDPMMGAPSLVDLSQLDELRLKVIPPER